MYLPNNRNRKYSCRRKEELKSIGMKLFAIPEQYSRKKYRNRLYILQRVLLLQPVVLPPIQLYLAL
jgi:hypothetical protein